jgi:hypothetical protein
MPFYLKKGIDTHKYSVRQLRQSTHKRSSLQRTRST